MRAERSVVTSHQAAERLPKISPACARKTCRALHFLQCANFDLSDTLARDAKAGSEFVERERRVAELARFEDLTFAVIEEHECLA